MKKKTDGAKSGSNVILQLAISTVVHSLHNSTFYTNINRLSKPSGGIYYDIDAYCSRADNIWARIGKLGYAKLEGLRLAALQRGFLQGAHSEHSSLRYLQQKLQHNDVKLDSWTDRKDFSKYIENLLIQGEIAAGGSIAKLPPSAAARAAGDRLLCPPHLRDRLLLKQNADSPLMCEAGAPLRRWC